MITRSSEKQGNRKIKIADDTVSNVDSEMFVHLHALYQQNRKPSETTANNVSMNSFMLGNSFLTKSNMTPGHFQDPNNDQEPRFGDTILQEL